VTFYALSLPAPSTPTAKTTVTLTTVTSHQSVPKPHSLPQTAEAVLMLWSADLLSPLAGLSPADRTAVEEVKIKVKTPTPRIGEIRAPQTFDVAYTKGGATVTFTSKGPIADLTSEPQVRWAPS
jgi:oligosaccharyltransferase complex subunit alpha (ribophorin I)